VIYGGFGGVVGACLWVEKKCLELAAIWGFDKKLIVPTSVDNFRFKDFRPKDCSMSHKKAESVLKTRFWNIREGLTDMKE